jgi:ring-1,2-phenylacetyl-CoA epoxidase subunit PaaE
MNKVSLVVDRIIPQGTDAVELVFLDEQKQIGSFWPGQFITLLLEIEGKSVRRSYSICSVPEELPRLAVCVKKVAGGLASHYLNQQLKVGDRVEVLEPYGNFSLHYTQSALPDLVLVAAGSGITPMLSMLRSSLTHAGNRIYLFYGSRSYADILFRPELAELQARYPERLRIAHYLSRDQHAECATGRLDLPAILHSLNSWPAFRQNEANFYLCGPKSLMDAVETGLSAHGTAPARIHRESFVLTVSENTTETRETPPPAGSDAGKRTSYTVQLVLEGRTHSLSVGIGRHILETALDAGLDLPYACTMGVCGMCRAFKVQGQMHIGEQEALSRSELEQGYCLTCVGTPLSDDLLIDYDRK